jgi:hypothetical protein
MSTPPLAPPDSHYLTAAVGWLELGDPVEAVREIERIDPAHLEHPDVLEVRWQISTVDQNWEAGLALAEKLVAVAPDRSSGWIHRAYCLRRVKAGSLQAAWDALRPVYDKFPSVVIIPYNLACYAAQFGRLNEAWSWLHKAMEIGGHIDTIKKMALADADLKALWDRIRKV